MALSKPTSAVKLPSLAHAIAKMKGVPPPADPNARVTAQAQAEIDPVLKAVTDRVNAKAQAGMGAISGYTQQLASQLGGYKDTARDIYSGAQQSQAATDAALSNRLSGGGTELADQLAARLAGINAPGATGAAAASVTQNGVGAGNALYGKGSASQSALIAQGAGAQDYAAKLPGIAALGGLQAGKELQLKSASDLADKTAQVETQLPTIINQIRGQQQSASQYAQTRSDRQAAQQDLNKYRSDSLAKRGTSGGKIIKGPDGYYQVDSAGNATKLGVGLPPTSTKAAAAPKLQHTAVNGHAVTFDPGTGSYYIPGTTVPIPQDWLTKSPKPAKVSVKAIADARRFLFAKSHGYDALKDNPDEILTPEQAQQARNRGQEVLHVGVGQHEDKEIQQLYLTLVQKYGLPAQRAFQIVAGQFKPWGDAHRSTYFPNAGKAGAAAEPAAYTRYATLAPGADRPGASTSSAVVDFVGKVGQMVGRRLTIGTGTNHNEYVVGTKRVSDHWAGNAADIPASGAALTQLGQAALVAAGADPAWARQQTGGLFNVNGYQIIFNSNEGGNHYNHLHVGVRSSV